MLFFSFYASFFLLVCLYMSAQRYDDSREENFHVTVQFLNAITRADFHSLFDFWRKHHLRCSNSVLVETQQHESWKWGTNLVVQKSAIEFYWHFSTWNKNFVRCNFQSFRFTIKHNKFQSTQREIAPKYRLGCFLTRFSSCCCFPISN